MNKVFLFTLLMFVSFYPSLSNAQSFTMQYGDTAYGTGWDNISLSNDITNKTAIPFAITWNLVSTDFPSSWSFGIGDNTKYYYSTGVGGSHTSAGYIPDTPGNFGMQIYATGGTVGTHYATVQLSGGGTTKNIVFIITKVLQADTINCNTGSTGCVSSVLSSPGSSYGVDVSYLWQYSSDGIHWSNAGTGGSYTITSISGTSYYRYIVSASGYAETDTSPVYKVIPPPPAAVSIHASPGTIVPRGTLVTFTATTTQAGASPTWQWQKNGIDIPGATADTYASDSLVNNDAIDCIMHGRNDCYLPDSAQSNKLVIGKASGIHILSSSFSYSIYPNPSSGIITVKGNGLSDRQLTVEIINMVGQLLYKDAVLPYNGQFEKTITLTNAFTNGIYMLRLTDDVPHTQLFTIKR